MKNSNQPYSRMAEYYDSIYRKIVDYESQADHLERIFQKLHNDRVCSILDVACGTGNYTFIFAKRRYKVTGIDFSSKMIRIARRKSSGAANPKFLEMDMRHIQLEDKFDVAAVLFGGFGYLHASSDIESFFSGVKKALQPKGLLVFEFWHSSAIMLEATTPAGRKNYDVTDLGSKRIIRLHTSKYDTLSGKLHLVFDVYVFDTKKKTLFDSFSETHVVETYSISEIRELLHENGMKPLEFYKGDVERIQRLELARRSTFRVLATARV